MQDHLLQLIYGLLSNRLLRLNDPFLNQLKRTLMKRLYLLQLLHHSLGQLGTVG